MSAISPVRYSKGSSHTDPDHISRHMINKTVELIKSVRTSLWDGAAVIAIYMSTFSLAWQMLPWNKMLKTREYYNTYLTHVRRHHCSRQNLVKWSNIRRFQPTLWLSSAIDVDLSQSTCTADESPCVGWNLRTFDLFPGSLCSSDVYRRESGRCCTIPFFLTLFIATYLNIAVTSFSNLLLV